MANWLALRAAGSAGAPGGLWRECWQSAPWQGMPKGHRFGGRWQVAGMGPKLVGLGKCMFYLEEFCGILGVGIYGLGKC